MKNVYIDMIFVLLGNLILAFAVRVFILPYSILSGGVAGIGVSLQK
ncbi:MAG: YitT family protein, partial [Erysipelotrichaceae bacterium]